MSGEAANLHYTAFTTLSAVNITPIDRGVGPDLTFTWAPEVRLTDVDEAAEALTRVFVPAKLTPTGTPELDMRMNAVQFPIMTAGYLHFGADVAVTADDVSAYYIDTPLSGSAVNQWRDGRVERTTAGSAAVFSPGSPCELNWSSDCGQICLKVSEPQMRRQLEAMLNQPVRQRITFSRRLKLNTKGAANWFDLVQILAREAGRPDGLIGHRLARENLQQLLVQGLLQIQPHNYTEALSAGESPASPAAVRQAIDLIQAHPETPWCPAQLAQATSVSVRTLQKAFQRCGYPPPMAYLRGVRLNKVHEELVRSSPGEVMVTTVAGRWGFLHMGRFATQYRQLFGESPSTTLRAGG